MTTKSTTRKAKRAPNATTPKKARVLIVRSYKELKTGAFNCNLYLGTTLVARVRNSGRGGPNFYDWTKAGVRSRGVIDAIVSAAPPLKFGGKEYAADMDTVVEDLSMVSQFKRRSRSHVIFMLKTHAFGESMEMKWTDAALSWPEMKSEVLKTIKKKGFSTDGIKFINDRFI